MHNEGWKQAQGNASLRYRGKSHLLAVGCCPFGPSRLSHLVPVSPLILHPLVRLLKEEEEDEQGAAQEPLLPIVHAALDHNFGSRSPRLLRVWLVRMIPTARCSRRGTWTQKADWCEGRSHSGLLGAGGGVRNARRTSAAFALLFLNETIGRCQTNERCDHKHVKLPSALLARHQCYFETRRTHGWRVLDVELWESWTILSLCISTFSLTLNAEPWSYLMNSKSVELTSSTCYLWGRLTTFLNTGAGGID